MATSFDQIVGQYLSDPSIGGATQLDVKKAQVDAASQSKKNELSVRNPEPVPFYNVAAVRQRGSGLSTITDPTQRDLATMDNWSLYNRYGSQVDQLFNQYNVGASSYAADRQTPGTVRGSRERAQDVGISVAQGFANSTLGIGALAAGLVSDTAGTWSARKLGKLNEWMDGGKSDQSEIRRRLYGVENSLDTADNKEQFEQDRVRDGEFVATLKRFGRDTFDTLGNVWINNEIFRDTLAQGAGSLLAGGPLAKGLKTVGKMTLGRVASAKAAELGARAAMPLTIGAMEAGGAYQQSIMDAYLNLDGRTDLTDDQKASLANRAGLTAAAIQAPIAAATGTLVSKFEANPLRGVTARTAVQNILKEGLEEGVQSASGQLATNVGIRQNVDQTRDLMEGVGEQTAQGIVGGLGSAALIQSPQIALRTAVGSAKLAGRSVLSLGSKAAGALEDRNQRILDQVQSESPVAAPKMDAAINAAQAAAPEIRESLAQSVQNNTKLSDEERNSVVSHFDNVMRFDDAEADRVPSIVGDAIRGSTDRFDAVRRVTQMAGDTKQAPENRLAAGLYLMDTLRRNQTMLENIPEAIEKMSDDDPAVQQVNDYQSVLESLQRHPAVREAIQAAIQFSSNITPESVSEQAISTPEGQQAAQSAVQLSSLAPDRSNPDVNKQVLLHAQQGRIQLTPEQVGYLQSANVLKEVEERHAQKSEALGLTNSEVISREIQTDKSDPGTLHKSAISHMEGITAAVDAGNIPLASRRMQHFMNFAQSMQNKVQALNANLLTGNGSDQNSTPYEAYNPRTGKFFTSKPGAYLIGGSRGSVAQAQQTAVDAEAVGYLANELAKSFPQLQVAPIELAQLNAAVSQSPAREAARDYKIAQRDGTLDEFMGLSEATSPNKAPQTVLDETNREDDRNNRQEKSAPIEETATPAPRQSRSEDVRSEDPVQRPDPSQDQRKSDAGEAETAQTVQDDRQPSETVEEVRTPQSDAPSEVEPAKTSPVDQSYPNLLGSNDDGGNLFKQSFFLPDTETPISRLATRDDAIPVLLRALSSKDELREFTEDKKLANKLTPSIARAYDQFIKRIGRRVGERMEAQLQEALQSEKSVQKKKTRLIDRLNDPVVRGFDENRALAIAEVDEKGGITYNSALHQGVLAAGLQWLLSMDQRSRNLDAEDVSKILGIEEHEVEDSAIKELNRGVYFNNAVSDLSRSIVKFWGVKAAPNAPIGVVDGIAEGVAKELLRALAAEKVIRINMFEIREGTGEYKTRSWDGSEYEVDQVKKYPMISLALLENKTFKENVYPELIKAPMLIESAVLTEPELVTYIDQIPPKRSTNQLRNTNVELTKNELEMRNREEQTPHYLNKSMAEYLTALGVEGAQEVFGYGDIGLREDGVYNEEHWNSLEGSNLNIASAINTIERTVAELEHIASIDGRDAGELPVRYTYDITSVGRLQANGPQNPQANKLTRETFLPTWSTLDLSNPTTSDMGRFMLGMGQALGLKVHRQTRAETANEVSKLLATDYARMIQAIRTWNKLSTSAKANEAVELGKLIRSSLDPENNASPTAVAVMAAFEFARFLDADQDARAKFKTPLYVEADGVTDGPINAMLHMARGAFTKSWINTMRKGGLFTLRGETMNSYSSKKELGGDIDLYQQTTDYLKDFVGDLRQKLIKNNNSSVLKQMDNLQNLMVEFGMNMSIKDGNLIIQRGAVKNPLTVKIYGASASGITSKVVSLLMKEVYARESAILQAEDPAERTRLSEYRRLLEPLLNKSVEINYGQYSLKNEQTTSFNNVDAKFKINAEGLKVLSSNIRALYVAPMQKAISKSIGETEVATNLIQKMTQIMSIAFRDAFQKGISDKLNQKEAEATAKKTGWKRKDFLTREELQEIFNGAKHLAPFVRTGTQNIMISGNDTVEVKSVFSRTLDGKMSTQGRIRGPQAAGVSGIPYTVIGTGDGQMMQTFSIDAGPGSKHILIFDGANFSLDQLEENSEAINKAVYEGWMKNPFKNVADMFERFLDEGGMNAISESSQEELDRVFGKSHTIESIRAAVQNVSEEIQARKAVLTRISMTVDHMASAEAPYVHEGEYLGDLNDDQLETRLIEMYDEELNKIQKIKKEPEIEYDRSGDTEMHKGNGIIRLLMQTKGGSDPLMRQMARKLATDGHEVYVGPIGALLEAAATAEGRELPELVKTSKIGGFYTVNTKRLFLSDEMNLDEFLAHEIVHATTIQNVYAYYEQNGAGLNDVQKSAIARLDTMLDEWLELTEDVTDLDPETERSLYNARREILHYLPNLRYVAMNEFMAWNLSNQELISFNKGQSTKTRIGKIIGQVMEAMKSLLGLPGSNFQKNLRFNAALVLDQKINAKTLLKDTILFQAEGFGSSDRLTSLREQFFDKVARHIYDQPNPAAKLTAQYKSFVAKVQSDAVLDSFNAHGFPMDKQQASTFQMMVAALATEIELNTNSLQRVQELYAHVSKTLKVEDFMTDPESTNPADRFNAQEKYNSVLGTNLTEIDEQGRSTLLPSFLALAAVDDGFREVLSKMELPKGERMEGQTLDARLTNLGSEMMDRLGTMMGGEGRNQPNVRAAIDVLTDRLAFVGQDQKDFIDQFVSPAGTAIDKANQFVIDQMQSLSQRASDKLEEVKQRTNKKSVRALANIGQLTAGIFNEDIASAQAESLMSAANKYLGSKTLHEFLNEMVGRTPENASVYDMIKTVRSAIQQMRQQFREHLPELLAKRFSRPVTEAEQTAMFRGLAKTDLASLRSGYSVAQIVELLADPNKVASEAQAIELRLKKIQNGSFMIQKAQELATFMNTGKAPYDLLRNAFAIARIGGKVAVEDSASSIVQDIDHLVSLYAVDGLNQADRDALSSLVQDEKDGVSFMLSYLEGQRRDELAGAKGNEVAQLNHFKGYVPSTQEGKAFGRTLIVADDADYLSLRQRGFNRVANYDGMDAENGGPRRGYYFSSLSGRAAYSQGILQTVHVTVSGIDPVTGFSTSVGTAGKITDPDAVQRIQKRLSRSQRGNEQLLPVFDKDGNVVAYERSLDPLQEERLGRSTNAMNMMGVWRGRQVEEGLAQRYNDALIDRLHSMWDKEELVRKDEYMNLFDKRELRADPVLADAVRLIPRESREKIASLYGENQFWVRRDMLNDAIGYRKASAGDAWTGNTRYSEETQRNIRSLATNIFGVDAFKRITQAEKTFENFITDARVTIVVKSVIVPFGNLVNNIFQLSARGVPLATTIKGMPRKTAEVDGYIKGRIRVMEIDAEIRAAEGANDVVAQRKLGVEKQSIEDGWKRLSIWPLIEAGELTSVSDVGLGKEEIDLTEGRLNEYMEKLTEKLPDSVKTAGKYFIVSKDTALFKGLQKAVEYGDFLAKAILYDDLTKRQGLTREQALAKVTEEYVNYDRLSGRTRDKLESMGLLWFWHFKVRSVKVALSMVRNNPVHAFLTMLTPSLPVVGDIGNPITDNVLTQAFKDQLGYSIGPTRALSAHQMNPWVGMVF